MTDRVTPAHFLREGGRRIELYNEGLLVYLYDESRRDSLQRMGAARVIDAQPEKLSEADARALASLGRTGALVAFELVEDDPVLLDLHVGPPLTLEEEGKAHGLRWERPQKARLVLPTGQLRLETANSCELDPLEPPGEQGVTVQVPPGEYVVTLHRIDFDETDEGVREGAPEQVITLTPVDETQALRGPRAFLGLPERRQSHSWQGKVQITGGSVELRVCFWDAWDQLWLNLARADAERLGLAFGSQLELHAAGRSFRVVFLPGLETGLVALANHKLFFGHERMTAKLAALPEVALATWVKESASGAEALACGRVRAAAPFEGRPETWHKARAKVLPERLEPVDLADLGRQSHEGSGLRGTVLARNGRLLTASFDDAALQALEAGPGSQLVLRSGATRATVRLFANSREAAAALQKPTALGGPRHARWEALEQEYAAAPEGSPARAEAQAQLRRLLALDTDLVGSPERHWYAPEHRVLLLQPAALDKPGQGISFELPLPGAPGDPLLLER